MLLCTIAGTAVTIVTASKELRELSSPAKTDSPPMNFELRWQVEHEEDAKESQESGREGRVKGKGQSREERVNREGK